MRELLRVDDPSKVVFSTTHGFKGNQADAVLLLSVTGGSYPLIHPTWPLYQVFGDAVPTLTDAERRLFYVALSRPKTYLDVFVDRSEASDFWETAKRGADVSIHIISDLAEPTAVSGDLVEVRISGWETSQIKRALELDGYSYRGKPEYCWVQFVDRTRYNDAALIARPRWRPGIRVEVLQAGRVIFTHAGHTLGGQRSANSPPL